MTMRILMVCMSDPRDGKKGDTKLVRKRQVVLERMGCAVDLLYFQISLGKNSIEVKSNQKRKGVDIVIRISVGEVVKWLVKARDIARVEPVQTWFSYGAAEILKERLISIFGSYTTIHFVHMRSAGLWGLATDRTRVIVDLIDSYTLNIGNRLASEKSWWARRLLEVEYERVKELESDVERYFRNPCRVSVLAVAEADLRYIGTRSARRLVVPVGIDVECLQDKNRKEGKLRCVFFGNLDYEPNIKACDVIIEVVRILRRKGLAEMVEVTVAGRNASAGLRRRLNRGGIEVKSPVDDMYRLVSDKDVAVVPMVSGSGMQSKVLEAISWGVVVIATKRAARPVGLIRDEEYIAVETAEDIVDSLLGVVNGMYAVDEIRRNAHKRIAEFEWEKTCKRLMQEYRA